MTCFLLLLKTKTTGLRPKKKPSQPAYGCKNPLPLLRISPRGGDVNITTSLRSKKQNNRPAGEKKNKQPA